MSDGEQRKVRCGALIGPDGLRIDRFWVLEKLGVERIWFSGFGARPTNSGLRKKGRAKVKVEIYEHSCKHRPSCGRDCYEQSE